MRVGVGFGVGHSDMGGVAERRGVGARGAGKQCCEDWFGVGTAIMGQDIRPLHRNLHLGSEIIYWILREEARVVSTDSGTYGEEAESERMRGIRKSQLGLTRKKAYGRKHDKLYCGERIGRTQKPSVIYQANSTSEQRMGRTATGYGEAQPMYEGTSRRPKFMTTTTRLIQPVVQRPMDS